MSDASSSAAAPAGSSAESLCQRRARAFIASLPPELSAREDSAPAAMRSMNASRRTKLFKIYQLADEISAVREPFVACGKACAHCCHMSIRLTTAEAERLGGAIGRPPTKLAATKEHTLQEFAGQPCPFLVDDCCSVYEHRPLACRTHASFEADNARCHPDIMNIGESAIVTFDGLERALFETSAEGGSLVVADIRDFFPAKATSRETP